MESPADQAHQAIGLAVLGCQAVEVLFALCVRQAFGQAQASTLRETTPLEKNFSKPPMKRMLAELRKHADVSAEFESAMLSFIDRRHILVHRWAIEHGLPEDDAAHMKLAMFAIEVAQDAVGLSQLLHGYVINWMRRFPEFENSLSLQQAKWLADIPEKLRSLRVERVLSRPTR
jgi:hypothetical protein